MTTQQGGKNCPRCSKPMAHQCTTGNWNCLNNLCGVFVKYDGQIFEPSPSTPVIVEADQIFKVCNIHGDGLVGDTTRLRACINALEGELWRWHERTRKAQVECEEARAQLAAAKAERDRMEDAIVAFANEVQKLAYEIEPPNSIVPQLVGWCIEVKTAIAQTQSVRLKEKKAAATDAALAAQGGGEKSSG